MKQKELDSAKMLFSQLRIIPFTSFSIILDVQSISNRKKYLISSFYDVLQWEKIQSFKVFQLSFRGECCLM